MKKLDMVVKNVERINELLDKASHLYRKYAEREIAYNNVVEYAENVSANIQATQSRLALLNERMSDDDWIRATAVSLVAGKLGIPEADAACLTDLIDEATEVVVDDLLREEEVVRTRLGELQAAFEQAESNIDAVELDVEHVYEEMLACGKQIRQLLSDPVVNRVFSARRKVERERATATSNAAPQAADATTSNVTPPAQHISDDDADLVADPVEEIYKELDRWEKKKKMQKLFAESRRRAREARKRVGAPKDAPVFLGASPEEDLVILDWGNGAEEDVPVSLYNATRGRWSKMVVIPQPSRKFGKAWWVEGRKPSWVDRFVAKCRKRGVIVVFEGEANELQVAFLKAVRRELYRQRRK